MKLKNSYLRVFLFSKIKLFQKMKYVIIVAGGSGSRMKSQIPKQFLELEEKTILQHSIEAFYCFDNQINIVVVLPKNQIVFWKEICGKNSQTMPKHQITIGGETRFHSVKNGLKLVSKNSLVAIHDGVRPLIEKEVIANCFKVAEQKGNAIPAIKPVDSLRFVENDKNKAVNREQYRAIQTPQTFKTDLIKKAYNQEFSSLFTDDASVLENIGEEIFLVEGSRKNIKITTPEDLLIAKVLKS